jgi:ribosome-binding factor A
MPRTARPERVADLLQRTLAKLLQREAKDPRFAAVTITAVNVSPDLKNATIYVCMLDETKVKDTVAALNKASGYLRHSVAEAVELRITPTLQFRYDESLSRGQRLSKLIDEALTRSHKD